jgi:hypothetical protein
MQHISNIENCKITLAGYLYPFIMFDRWKGSMKLTSFCRLGFPFFLTLLPNVKRTIKTCKRNSNIICYSNNNFEHILSPIPCNYILKKKKNPNKSFPLFRFPRVIQRLKKITRGQNLSIYTNVTRRMPSACVMCKGWHSIRYWEAGRGLGSDSCLVA